MRLLRGLIGRAWRKVERIPIEKFKVDGGHNQVVAALEGRGEEVITKKKEQFENFFRHGYRERGETIPGYIRRKEELYIRMRQIHTTTQLSDDLYACFMLGRQEARR